MGMMNHRLSLITHLIRMDALRPILTSWVPSGSSRVAEEWTSGEEGRTEGESSEGCGTIYPFMTIGSKITDPTAYLR